MVYGQYTMANGCIRHSALCRALTALSRGIFALYIHPHALLLNYTPSEYRLLMHQLYREEEHITYLT